MKQLLQNFKTGELLLKEVPPPALKPGCVLVRNAFSLISAGTERSTVKTAQASLIGKAKQRPDLVKQVMDNIKREGLIATYKKVKTRLETLKPLGYSSAGVVLESSCEEFQPGDRVVCAGAGYASHAEVVFVPKNLCVKVPDSVGLNEAAFATLGAIAMQGVRQAEVRVGERVVVIGLGLLGLLTVSILKAAGCKVLGADISDIRFSIAEELGCDQLCLMPELIRKAERFTKGNGADAVLLTAATHSNEPIEVAGEIARKKARVVVVGVVGLNVPRDPYYYQKELDIRFSCSYGPGRYDPEYEEKGRDYPIGYVRWTEKRNMEAFLDLLAERKVKVKPLISHVFPIDKALEAYDLILGKRKEPYAGILLKYEHEERRDFARVISTSVKPKPHRGEIRIGFIGAGNFAQSYLIPNLKSMNDVRLKLVCTATGVNAKAVAEKFGFEGFTTDAEAVLSDPEIDVVFIATRHNLHAPYVIKSLKAEKHTYVEKPLCIKPEELGEILKAYQSVASNPKLLMVGFNRRFSPAAQKVREFFSERVSPLVVNIRVNAGFLPKSHWLQTPEEGGGRIIGEVCHFVDLARYWIDKPVISIFAQALPDKSETPHPPDNVSIVLKYSDGSIANILYLANGDPSVSKEYYEVFGGGKTAILEDFRRVLLAERGKSHAEKAHRDKGHRSEITEVIRVIREGKESPISFESLVETTKVTFAIVESIGKGSVVNLGSEEA